MATDAQRERVRFDTGYDSGDGGGLSNAVIDGLYTDAATLWTSSAAIEAQVRIDVIDNLLMQAAKRTDYSQNESVEKSGQIFDHLWKAREKFQKALDLETTVASAPVMFGGLRRYNKKTIQVPSDYEFPNGNKDLSRFEGEQS